MRLELSTRKLFIDHDFDQLSLLKIEFLFGQTSEFKIKDPFEQFWDQGHRSLNQDVQTRSESPETVRRDAMDSETGTERTKT